MIVRELIDMLETHPEDSEVKVYREYEGGSYTVKPIENVISKSDVESIGNEGEDEVLLVVDTFED